MTPGSTSVLEWNDSRGVLLSWHGTTPGEYFCSRIERIQGSPSVLGKNDSRGSFCPGIERLQVSHSVLGLSDPREVILSRDRTNPGESFCPRMEGLQWSHSVLRWNDSRGVILS